MEKSNHNKEDRKKVSKFNPYVFTAIFGIIGAAIITVVLISLL